MRAFVAGLGFSLFLTAAARAEAPDIVRARALYEQGKSAYASGAYAEAFGYFDRAYELSHAPALLFDMAQARRLSGPERCEQALELYRRYLVEDPRASNRDEAAERIGEMRACVEHQKQLANAEPAPAKPEASAAPAGDAQATRREHAARAERVVPLPARRRGVAHRNGSRTGPILLTGIGASMAIAGTILYARAKAKYDEAKAVCPCPDGEYSSWKTLTNVSYGLMASGAAVTAGGVFWLATTPEQNPPRISGFVLQAAGRF
jgi:tetratricopeptide (TPR) repeat protein